MDKQQAADEAHKPFVDPTSDFITVLRIWRAYQDADQARINRREFIDAYRGYELDPNWLDRMGTMPRGLTLRNQKNRLRKAAGCWHRF